MLISMKEILQWSVSSFRHDITEHMISPKGAAHPPPLLWLEITSTGLDLIFTTTLQERYCSHAVSEETGLENTLPQITYIASQRWLLGLNQGLHDFQTQSSQNFTFPWHNTVNKWVNAVAHLSQILERLDEQDCVQWKIQDCLRTPDTTLTDTHFLAA